MTTFDDQRKTATATKSATVINKEVNSSFLDPRLNSPCPITPHVSEMDVPITHPS